MKRVTRWVIENSLWIVSMGLMLASSGLDGVYIARWMPPGWGWLGLILNTMSDVGNLVLMYWYGRLKLSASSSKRYRLATALLPAEGIAVVYSWFMSWRQLRAVLPAIEPADWRWVAPISAGFIPLMLAFIGWAQALLAGKAEMESAPSQASGAAATRAASMERAVLQELAAERAGSYLCPHCERTFTTQSGLNAHQRAHAAKSNGSSKGIEQLEQLRGER